MPHAPNGSRHCFTTMSGKKTVISTYPLDRSLVLLLYLVVAFAQAAWPICNSLNQTREDAKNQLIGAKRDWLKWFNQNNSTSSIKVYVYDKPPFNWLHSVSPDNIFWGFPHCVYFAFNTKKNNALYMFCNTMIRVAQILKTMKISRRIRYSNIPTTTGLPIKPIGYPETNRLFSVC